MLLMSTVQQRLCFSLSVFAQPPIYTGCNMLVHTPYTRMRFGCPYMVHEFSSGMATVSVSTDGHFNIPEGTTTIYYISWRTWGVDEKA